MSGLPVFYVQTGGRCNERDGLTGDRLYKYVGLNPAQAWTRVDTVQTLPGGIGTFGVDPNNADRLYVSNLCNTSCPSVGGRMMFSIDGGASWENDAELDARMTGLDLVMPGEATFKFGNRAGLTDPFRAVFGGYAQPSLVAFDPSDPEVIVAAGRDSGVFLTTNGGQDWDLLTEPIDPVFSHPHIPRPHFAHFKHEPGVLWVYLGTQGRGVWRLRITEADLSITGSDNPDPVVAGTDLEYTLAVENHGPSRADNVIVTDTLPPDVDFVSASGFNWNCNHVAGTVTCNWQGGNPVGSLAAGEAANAITITVTVKPSALGVITNAATVAPKAADPDAVNNSVQIGTTVIGIADLAIMKEAAPNPVLDGGFLIFTIHVQNLGPSDAQNAVLSEQVPEMTGFHSIIAPPGWSCSTPPPLGTGTVTCMISTFPAGAMAEFRVRVVVDLAGVAEQIVNTVAISSDTEDPAPGNGSASLSTQALKAVPALNSFGTALAVAVLLLIANRRFWPTGAPRNEPRQ